MNPSITDILKLHDHNKEALQVAIEASGGSSGLVLSPTEVQALLHTLARNNISIEATYHPQLGQ